MQLPDIVALGIYNSQKAVPNTEISKNRKTTLFEIELPMENGGFSFVNGEKVAIVPNMIICSKPGQSRHTHFPYKCYYIHMILKEGPLYDELTALPDFIETIKYDLYREIFEKLCKYYDTAYERDQIMLQSLVLELIYHLSRESVRTVGRKNSKSNNHLIIEKVLKYIREHLTEELDLETLADIASLSPIHFHKCFKASVGKTVRDYVEEQRIKKAVNLLMTTELTLTEIAFECGFSSQSYFSYVFKRRMGVTPREHARLLFRQYEK